MIGEKGAHTALLQFYINSLLHGVPQEQAALEAFGDLGKLEVEVHLYIRNGIAYNMTVKAPAGLNDKDLQVRELSDAESEAYRGDFQVHRGHLTEAMALLEDSIRQKPNLALAQEALGSPYYTQHTTTRRPSRLFARPFAWPQTIPWHTSSTRSWEPNETQTRSP